MCQLRGGNRNASKTWDALKASIQHSLGETQCVETSCLLLFYIWAAVQVRAHLSFHIASNLQACNLKLDVILRSLWNFGANTNKCKAWRVSQVRVSFVYPLQASQSRLLYTNRLHDSLHPVVLGWKRNVERGFVAWKCSSKEINLWAHMSRGQPHNCFNMTPSHLRRATGTPWVPVGYMGVDTSASVTKKYRVAHVVHYQSHHAII